MLGCARQGMKIYGNRQEGCSLNKTLPGSCHPKGLDITQMMNYLYASIKAGTRLWKEI
jgi:hypothetical protein